MSKTEPAFTLGIEEEYLLVDPETRGLVSDPPAAFFEECKAGLNATHEFLRSQVEISTPVCKNIAEGRKELTRLRGGIIKKAREHGMAVIAASSHPFSSWKDQIHTDAERYENLSRNMQGAARQMVISGMHVHVECGDGDARIDMMNQMCYFLPHLLAFSSSSPFWEGKDTGLASYRTSVFKGMPRTGLPEYFDSEAEYLRHVDVLTAAGIIKDSSEIWWDLRPSAHFPTLELRICDMCTRLDDAVTLAAVYICLVRMLHRLKQGNQRWRRYSPMLINENRWRAQRYGIDGGLVDFGKGDLVPVSDLAEEILELISEDAEALDCAEETAGLREIIRRKTSAHGQRAVHREILDSGGDEHEALCAVTDYLITETARGAVQD